MGSEKKDKPFVGPSDTRLPSLAATDRVHRTRSPRSQCTPTSSPDLASTAKIASPEMSLSCVTRGTSRDDCSYSRFLAWAAVQRNASRFMSSSDRLSCPLIRCRKLLLDHESMLKHLASCPQLPTREYWCYDHMRVEHFDDVKCRRCISHPSRRRRMLSLAKGFFSTLGHKSKRGPELEFGVDDSAALAPPSYLESLNCDPPPEPAEPELSSTEILEIDSTEVMVPQATAHAVPIVDPQALALPELDSTMVPSQTSLQWQPEPWDVSQPSNKLTAAIPTCESVAARLPASQGPSQDTPYSQQGPRPVTAAPRSKHLSPSSSVRSTTSTMSNISNISSVTTTSSLWSTPSTAWSGFETNLTTPPTGLISPVDTCQEHDFPLLAKQYPSDPLGMLPELPELEADMPPMPELSSEGLFSFDTDLTRLSYPENFVLEEESAGPQALSAETQGLAPIQSVTKSLVASAWDALQEHIVSSADKIRHLQNNPLVDQLNLLSAKTIAQRGFSSLRGILESRPSASPLDTLCLVHVVYSFALVVYGDDAARRSNDLYTQSLLYSAWFIPDNQAFYRDVVKAIWQPRDMTFEQSESLEPDLAIQAGFPRSSKGKGRATKPPGGTTACPDPLVTTALHFLDELEISAILGPGFETLASDLRARHLQDGVVDSQTGTPVAGNVNGLINALSILVNQYHNVDGLIAELSNVNQNINGGLILSTRRFELEALQAGQSCIVPVQYFDDYVPLVRGLCDTIYELDSSPLAPQRQYYYDLTMALSEALIVELDAAPPDASDIPELDSEDDALFDCIFDSLTPSLADDFIMDMDIETQPLLSPKTEEAPNPTDAAKPTHECIPPEDSTAALGTQSPSSSAFPSKNALQTPISPTSPPPQKHEMADACCELCGYRPKGDPRWFHGSMAKHKKTQHSTDPPKIYKCPYPGCTSAYKKRPDNLRQHQIEKNHFVDGQDETSRRPSKRKKTAL